MQCECEGVVGWDGMGLNGYSSVGWGGKGKDGMGPGWLFWTGCDLVRTEARKVSDWRPAELVPCPPDLRWEV